MSEGGFDGEEPDAAALIEETIDTLDETLGELFFGLGESAYEYVGRLSEHWDYVSGNLNPGQSTIFSFSLGPAVGFFCDSILIAGDDWYEMADSGQYQDAMYNSGYGDVLWRGFSNAIENTADWQDEMVEAAFNILEKIAEVIDAILTAIEVLSALAII